MKDLMELLKRKASEKDSHMGDNESQAYMDVLNELKSLMEGEMSKDLHQPKMEAHIAANSPEELKAGLNKAEHVVGNMDSEGSPEHESAESSDEEKSEDDEMADASAQDSEDPEAPGAAKRRFMKKMMA